ncbi:MAG: signal recognition particle protein [Pseudomonadota bacterium]|jgi:signal recognition particle subunit SRP54|nr:signal recognition particle protein [Pseudomonadota bacterium]
MFDQLGRRLTQTFRDIRGSARLTEDNVADTLREIRVALLEADVALPAVKAFIERVRERAVGAEVLRSLTPGQAVIKVVHDQLVELMGTHNDALDLTVRPPAVLMMVGLQGAGKTTTVAKLARLLKERESRRVMVVSTDVYRPAAVDQLSRLAEEVGVECFVPESSDPVIIASEALTHGRRTAADVVIIDTAGRLHIDEDMMEEVQRIHKAVEPVETLFVIDSMTGQDAVTSADHFNQALALTGVVLTKADSDARGGAALSVRHVTGCPIKFIGIGESTDALEPFYPDRIASRILGMGDVVGLVEEVERKVDRDRAAKVAKKLRKGKGFDLTDFRDQLEQMEQMGGLSSLIEKLPGVGDLPANVRERANNHESRRMMAIINSMTLGERAFPATIRGSRKKRIAAGSGTQVQEVNRLLKQFAQMQKMLKKAKRKGGLDKMMGQIKGHTPPGMPPFGR